MNFDGIFFELSDFELTDKFLGSGSFGKVYIVKCNKNKKEYAVKIINIDEHKDFSGIDQRNIMRESTILHDLTHPSIVKFYGVNFQSFTQFNKLEPAIITEYLPKGSLKEILEKERRGLADHEWTPTKKLICLIGISNAMKYLHEKGIIHRDLKPENVLIDKNYMPKVSDFGLSRCFPLFLSNSIKMTMTGQIGTPMYMPPEILMEERSHYGPEVDVYAFGILAYEIVTRKVPFYELGNKITPFGLASKVFSGYRPIIPNEVPEKMKELISKCWSGDPSERPSFQEIFSILSKKLTIIGEIIDEEEVQDYLDILQGYEQQQQQQQNEMDRIKEELKKVTESLCLLISSIENKSEKEDDKNDITDEKINNLCNIVENYKSICDIVINRLQISSYDIQKVDAALSKILNKNSEIIQNKNPINSDQLKNQIREQSKWTFYLVHILEQTMDLIKENEKKLNLENKNEDDSNTFKFVYERLKNLLDFCYSFYNRINERGGFDTIDDIIKERNELKEQILADEFARAKMSDEIIKGILGDDYKPSDLEVFLKAQNHSDADSLNELNQDKFGHEITADDKQIKMSKYQEDSIAFAEQVRQIIGGNDDEEILNELKKMKNKQTPT